MNDEKWLQHSDSVSATYYVWARMSAEKGRQ